MCGIAGFVTSHALPDSEKLAIAKAMNDRIRHRGPDEDGYYTSGPFAMGMRRLSIIDLSSGQQPIFNEDRSIGIVFNGEIYNYLELTDELIKKGHQFRTHSDTEAVVHMYEEYGPAMLSRLNGMFALALFDIKKQTVLFAVDRTGKKPLYYTYQDGHFLFGSEPKSFYAHPAFKAELDTDALHEYLAFEYVPAPRSIFKNVRKMEPAHYFILDVNKLHVEPEPRLYWNMSFEPKWSMSEEEYGERLRALLKNAVQRRLMSEVPLGVFLSGGIDSSSIVAMMAELMPPKNIKSFSIAFDDTSFDESSYARQVAAHFGTDHREEKLSPGLMLDIFPDIVSKLDEPFADASIIPTYLLSRFTRKYVTVALGGDGGDEFFAGYDTFPAHQIARYYEMLPGPLHALAKGAAGLLPVSTKNMSFDFRAKRFLAGMDYSRELRHQVWLGPFTAELQRQALVDSTSADPEHIYQAVIHHQKTSPALSYIDRIIYLYVKTYMHGDILVKVDRASLANSLEVRAPFLDVDLMEFANRIPDNLKIKGIKTKYILKKALAPKLPMNIIERPKKGFGIPISEWFKGELKPLLLDEFSESKLQREGLFNPAYVKGLLNDHFNSRRDNRKEIWTLLMFQLWKRNYLKE